MLSTGILLAKASSASLGGLGMVAATVSKAHRCMSTASTAGKKYLTVTIKDDCVAVIKFNQPDSKVNTLNKQLMLEFEDAYNTLIRDPAIMGAVVLSAKPNSFIAGADIDMLLATKSADEATLIAKTGQRLFEKIHKGKFPIVAAIHGDTLGGGLEFAMAAQYRIATDSPKTKFGVPEVMLGLLPGATGTQRLPRLVPLTDALDMMLTGKQINAVKAKKLGLIDFVLPQIGPGLESSEVATQKFLEDSAVKAVKDLATGVLIVNRDKSVWTWDGYKRYMMTDSMLVRRFILRQARRSVLQKTKGKYPAHLKILEAVETGFEKNLEEGLEKEAENFGFLSQTSEAKNLMSIFFAQRACKKVPEIFGSPSKSIKNMAVLGAGLMGSGIANVSLGKFGVTIKDNLPEGLAKGQEHIWKTLDKKVKRKAMTSFERDTMFTGLHAVLDYKHFDKADLVIEAVPEVLSIKHKVIKELEPVVPPDCIIATNTSALPIADVAKGAARPGNIVGMHYFSPVEKMPLLEIIPHAGTNPGVAASAFEAGTRQGKTCIVVKDVPGFYINRSLGPYNSEASALVCEGVGVQALDRAIVDFGFPVGPLTLGDEVGMDVAGHVQSFLAKHLGDRMKGGDPQFFADMVAKGYSGRKSGKGFYEYNKKTKTLNADVSSIIKKYHSSIDSSKISVEEMQMRPISRLLNEAVYCLQDKIILNPTDGDIGMVFGIGFPPFLGGPFRFIDSFGAQKLVDMMLGYQEKYGPQFQPAQLLIDMAKNGTRFHN